MTFTQDFKQRVFDTLQFSPQLADLMIALDQNDDTLVRMFIENAMDDVINKLAPRILDDQGEVTLYNTLVNQYNATLRIYSEYMEMFTKMNTEISARVDTMTNNAINSRINDINTARMQLTFKKDADN